MTARVVCISRTLGAGGEHVGQLVAHELGFRYLDEEIVADVAEREGVDVAQVADVEQQKGWLASLLEGPRDTGSPQFRGFLPSPARSRRALARVP